jgi:glycosyltransferase involved in cell wall biosynthesis
MVAEHRRSSLRIGLVAPASVRVPPRAYGGTEAVIDQLARGLVAAGHDVTLFTTGDSTCPVERRWIHREALGINAGLLQELDHVEAAYEELSDVDIVHDHTLLGPLWSHARDAVTPEVTTAHLPFTPELMRLYESVGTFAAVVAISYHQRASAPSVPIAAVIHHGIDVGAIPVGAGKGGYVLFLGRISPDKGVHHAIAAARAAGKRFVIAAKMWQPEERRYFTEIVQPLLGPEVEYVGEVDTQRKFALLAGAEALINPIGWPEPFGLVMVEALATGTPVLAFAQGAAPEIIDDGRTGFLCTDEADMVTKLGIVGELDRDECRRHAEERFSTHRMVARHVALYRRVLAEPRSAPLDRDTAHRSDSALRRAVLAERTVALRSANASA